MFDRVIVRIMNLPNHVITSYWSGKKWVIDKREAKRFYSERGLKRSFYRHERINASLNTHFVVEDYT